MSEPRFWVVIPAAGVGVRMGGATPKQYLSVAGRPIIAHTLARLCGHPRVSGVVVALARGDAWWPEVDLAGLPAPVICEGGAERCHSVLAGLRALGPGAGDADWVLVHDAVRPCLREADLARLIEVGAAHRCGALLAVPARDTMKRADAAGDVAETVSREGLWHALTPQMFRLGMLRTALEAAIAAGVVVTDESQAMEQAGWRPRLVPGSPDNVKITTPDDLAAAERWLSERRWK